MVEGVLPRVVHPVNTESKPFLHIKSYHIFILKKSRFRILPYLQYEEEDIMGVPPSILYRMTVFSLKL